MGLGYQTETLGLYKHLGCLERLHNHLRTVQARNDDSYQKRNRRSIDIDGRLRLPSMAARENTCTHDRSCQCEMRFFFFKSWLFWAFWAKQWEFSRKRAYPVL
ncbi:hypothetical protein Y032_0091g2462 [Ancylostoma ceylanicum]|uniref:Uncharacterized protein n=1 Tax=Ancylostoma ceylanicum TaxID=53326 RepID=A0A016TLH6_9BILA|nr:hypothetical protein Y032_0091g2462 [Ancylostoma ceylanicum]